MSRPVGPNQERYLLAETLTAPVYMMPVTNRIRGPLDIARLQAAIEHVCNRHETLRCRIERISTVQFQAVPEPHVAAPLMVVDLPGDATPDRIAATIRDFVMRKPDLSAQSLRLFQLIRLGHDHHLLTVSHHHSVSDGQSTQIFLQELFDAYRGAPEAAIPPPYSSFHAEAWTQTEAYRSAAAYWIDRLSGIGDATAIARDRQGGEDEPLSDSVETIVPQAVTEAVRAAAKRMGVSTFNFLYAVAAITLARQGGSQGCLTTFQSNGRRALKGSERTIGPFSNALIVAIDVDPALRFGDFVRGLRADVSAAIAHEAMPYHHVIRETGIHPHYGINAYPALARIEAGDIDVTPAEMPLRESDFDINFRFLDEPDRLSFYIYFAARFVSRDRIAVMAQQFVGLLHRFAMEPEAVIGDVPTEDEVAATAVRQTSKPPSTSVRPIHARFLDQARAHPDRIAIETPYRSLSYGELAHRAAQIAAHIGEPGATSTGALGIVALRGPDVVAAMLAASWAGRPFAVLDPEYPDQRLIEMIGLAGITTVLACGGTLERARELAQEASVACAALDDSRDRVAPDVPQPSGEGIAYYLFTSGSTGTPKCIATGHAPLGHFVDWQARTFGIGPEDRVTMLSGLSHDPVMRDVFTPLSAGATLLIPEGVALTTPGALSEWMVAARPTVAHMTPPLGRIMAIGHGARPLLSSLRWIFWGGDMLQPALLSQIAAIAPEVRSVNFYGATETPQAVATQIWNGDDRVRTVPVGLPVEGFTLTIEDAHGRSLARGEVGELVVRSQYLSEGYVVADGIERHAADADGSRRYLTGDRGFRLPDGAILLLGRGDDQIKVRGYRVELGEVAAALRRINGVSGAVVLPHDTPIGRSMAAFVEATAGSDLDPQAVETELGRAVPSYMVPDTIRLVDAIPLLPNGKIDRAALLALVDRPDEREAQPGADAREATAAEAEVVALWQSVLGRRAIGPNSSFASLGGDSLSFVEIAIATERKLGALPDRWETMTIADLARSKARTLPAWLTFIDTAMLVRAIAIILVVAGHFKLLSYGGGATTAMFLVTGFLIGRLQLAEVFRMESARPLLGLFLKVLIPVWLYSAALFTARTLFDDPPNLAMILLTENFVDYSAYVGSYRDGHDFFLWYVHCFLQIIAFVAAAAWLNFRLGKPLATPLSLCLALVVLGAIGRFALPFLFVEDFAGGVASLTMPNYLPTAHLGTVALGAVVAIVVAVRHKLMVSALTLGYAALSGWLYPSGGWALLILFGLALLYFERIVMVRALQLPVMIVSGASLFIYLTHFQWRSIVTGLGLSDEPVVHVLVGVAGGVVVWAIWQRLTLIVQNRFGRPLARSTIAGSPVA